MNKYEFKIYNIGTLSCMRRKNIITSATMSGKKKAMKRIQKHTQTQKMKQERGCTPYYNYRIYNILGP